ncbi:3-keto-disaccharide hydrolase [Stratiformator vulcanicus]|uniref:3-keto-alpha-glucoside-1,2-lyase/3-keto-2-hydroxy-glucal hydratase domain-containing protein n=1 Tax=Stratiformator vulcanicus TaxID=2527980 RepID=A0A517R305_9PLAN|nr:DUF1080 domain-containing protein [Stratiformator vulcanicus]QDT38262.1 hypothetical protein Pan189_26520 [Stratiformator vulcanicus]
MPSPHVLRRLFPLVAVCCALVPLCGAFLASEYKSGIKWEEPKVVDPGPTDAPPADAVVLFDGTDLSQWEGGEQWTIEDNYAITAGGGITTKEGFGDCQLHIEWAAPAKVEGKGQGRGNSGVFLMGRYEVQVLDSYENETYFDGQAGSLYKQWPPQVNASRKPGEWQEYDIIFEAPRFDKHGALLRPAYATVLHNGVVVQNHAELLGDTAWHRPPSYKAHPSRLPISLQFHGDEVRFRNIWIRELSPAVPEYPPVEL